MRKYDVPRITENGADHKVAPVLSVVGNGLNFTNNAEWRGQTFFEKQNDRYRNKRNGAHDSQETDRMALMAGY